MCTDEFEAQRRRGKEKKEKGSLTSTSKERERDGAETRIASLDVTDLSGRARIKGQPRGREERMKEEKDER